MKGMGPGCGPGDRSLPIRFVGHQAKAFVVGMLLFAQAIKWQGSLMMAGHQCLAG